VVWPNGEDEVWLSGCVDLFASEQSNFIPLRPLPTNAIGVNVVARFLLVPATDDTPAEISRAVVSAKLQWDMEKCASNQRASS
jgi:hypothetical protein